MWSERPLLVGVLLLLVLLWTVEVPDSIVGRHPMVVVPVLMWLWANIHGTFRSGSRTSASTCSGVGSTAARRWRRANGACLSAR